MAKLEERKRAKIRIELAEKEEQLDRQIKQLDKELGQEIIRLIREAEEKKQEGHRKIQDGGYKSAIACFDRVLQICKGLREFPPSEHRPKDEALLHGMVGALRAKGDALEKFGKHREASRCYKRALKIEPNLIKAEIIAMIDEALEE